MNHPYSLQTQHIIDFIRDQYGIDPEFLWPEKSPNCCIFRNPVTRKWFAAIMVIAGTKIGHGTDENLEIIDLKFDKGQALDFIENTRFAYPAYHMNKQNWFTMPLDNSLNDTQIFELIDHSYTLSDK